MSTTHEGGKGSGGIAGWFLFIPGALILGAGLTMANWSDIFWRSGTTYDLNLGKIGEFTYTKDDAETFGWATVLLGVIMCLASGKAKK